MTTKLLGENLVKSYGKTMAVDGLSLRVKSGEIVGFLGPNGAGTTTTLKMLVGLLKPDKGSITICGHDLANKSTAAKMKIGYVPDIPHLYEKLTPNEFFKFTAEVFRMPAEVAYKRVSDLMGLFGLEDYGRKLIGSLSHGTRQKVSPAAAVLHRPEILLLDEPTGGGFLYVLATIMTGLVLYGIVILAAGFLPHMINPAFLALMISIGFLTVSVVATAAKIANLEWMP